MIYDCFTFFNELDLLEIRLNILNGCVDKFVLVEMGKTHTGKDKPLVFEQNKERFSAFKDKIIHIIVDDYPELEKSESDGYGNKWLLENYQRDAIMRGLKNCKDDDIILISDLDEIPSPAAIENYAAQKADGIRVLEQKMMYYFINNICKTASVWFNGTRLGRYKDLLNPQQDLPEREFYQFSKKGLPTYFRFCQGTNIPDAGWHFSYCGGIDAIIKKRQSIVEQQFNTAKNMEPDYIKKMIAAGKDILDRKEYRYEALPLDNSFPQYIIDNQEKYSHLIFKITPFYLLKKILRKFEIKLLKIFLSSIRTITPIKKWRKNLRNYYKNILA